MTIALEIAEIMRMRPIEDAFEKLLELRTRADGVSNIAHIIDNIELPITNGKIVINSTILMEAIKLGQLKYVKILLDEYDTDYTMPICNGVSPLMMSCQFNATEITTYIIEKYKQFVSAKKLPRSVARISKERPTRRTRRKRKHSAHLCCN